MTMAPTQSRQIVPLMKFVDGESDPEENEFEIEMEFVDGESDQEDTGSNTKPRLVCYSFGFVSFLCMLIFSVAATSFFHRTNNDQAATSGTFEIPASQSWGTIVREGNESKTEWEKSTRNDPSEQERTFLAPVVVEGNESTTAGGGTNNNEHREQEVLSAASSPSAASRPLQLPPLSSLVDGTQIHGDVSSLLEVAIVGFAKCSTSFLVKYLNAYSEVFFANKEWCSFSKNRPAELIEQFYTEATSADLQLYQPPLKKKRGLKCPLELRTEFAVEHYATYFPRTKLMVQIRHPLSWFQSYYNFRLRGQWPKKMLPLKELVGLCDQHGSPYVSNKVGNDKHRWRVCTDGANFHHFLSRLGKTPMSSPGEQQLLQHNMTISAIQTQVFLMEQGQFSDDNDTRKDVFRQDLGDFLDLSTSLPPFPPHEVSENRTNPHEINICDEEFIDTRAVLMDISRDASTWIREYFFASPDVVVSSKEFFLERLQTWDRDPCDDSRVLKY